MPRQHSKRAPLSPGDRFDLRASPTIRVAPIRPKARTKQTSLGAPPALTDGRTGDKRQTHTQRDGQRRRRKCPATTEAATGATGPRRLRGIGPLGIGFGGPRRRLIAGFDWFGGELWVACGREATWTGTETGASAEAQFICGASQAGGRDIIENFHHVRGGRAC